MIINNDEASKRLNSPLNLINKLKETKANARAKAAMSIFIPPASLNKKEVMPSAPNELHMHNVSTKNGDAVLTGEKHPVENTSLDQILENSESQIKLGLAHDSALKLLNNSIFQLTNKLDDVKADKLPSVIAAASKTVESIRRERNEAAKNNKDREVHYHFYTPEQKTIEQYEVIDVG